jgi:hypothetical protein
MVGNTAWTHSIWGETERNVAYEEPPRTVSGMVNVRLDTQGRLHQLLAVPPQREATPGVEAEPPDWTVLFREAGLEIERFEAAESSWVPPDYSDTRRAWNGVYPENPAVPIRVEAAAYRGKPVFFQIVEPWTASSSMERNESESSLMVALSLWILAILLGGVVLARRNLRLGRGDGKGAFRFGLFVFTIPLVSWVVAGDHVADLPEVLRLLLMTGAFSVFVGVAAWLLYMALEPYARRLWPDILISWSRLLAGRIRDPLVGRDILTGALVGVAINLLFGFSEYVSQWVGYPPGLGGIMVLQSLLGPGALASAVINNLANALLSSMMIMMMLLLFRVILRKQWLAVSAFFLSWTSILALGLDHSWVSIWFLLIVHALMLVVLLRYGLLASIAMFTFHLMSFRLVSTLDLSAWYGRGSLITLLLLAALAAYAFYISLAGRPLLKDAILDES